ncbi:hypothetical protein [Cupriavidus taiwanensis]|uniref:hypothetical protein n=1 Tax=Cupriavidus taiwanensis TaxID=164546 RepID=UPI000E18C4C4|nr:hypothetical protein [Cupriavidus taiwanensis]SPA44655.1 conserved hypothetical protein [Cupriavidus taiwanensis]
MGTELGGSLMDDRELLELAAKADGITEYPHFVSAGVDDWVREWNPLENDGDALRLAVKLYLWEAAQCAHRRLGSPGCPDMYAATRRAIVLAAAEIGRSMP